MCFLQYSLCNEPLIELSNPGASGSLFYVSSDDEFIIKTVQHKEAEFLQTLLPGYFMVSVHFYICWTKKNSHKGHFSKFGFMHHLKAE